MVLIMPLHSRISSEIHVSNLSYSGSENFQLLCVDLQTDELWTSSLEDPNHLRNLETQWNRRASKIKNVIIKKVPEEDLDTASSLLRSSYNFYKDTSCAMLPSGINFYTVPSQLVTETYIQPGIDGVDILDMSTSRKLVLWAYTLLHGHCTHISAVIKYYEEHAKVWLPDKRQFYAVHGRPVASSFDCFVAHHTNITLIKDEERSWKFICCSKCKYSHCCGFSFRWWKRWSQ